jgi:hypothetical protein
MKDKKQPQFVDYVDLLGPPHTPEERQRMDEVMGKVRELFRHRMPRVAVPVSDLIRECDTCHKPYGEHPVDKEGVYNVCGHFVVLRSQAIKLPFDLEAQLTLAASPTTPFMVLTGIRKSSTPPDFVPDFHRCDACKNIGADHFGYDPNPKNLPPVSAPTLFVRKGELDPLQADPVWTEGPVDQAKLELRQAGKIAHFSPEAQWITRDPQREKEAEQLVCHDVSGLDVRRVEPPPPLTEKIARIFGEAAGLPAAREGGSSELRQAGKTIDFTEAAEQRARWTGTGPRRGVLRQALEQHRGELDNHDIAVERGQEEGTHVAHAVPSAEAAPAKEGYFLQTDDKEIIGLAGGRDVKRFIKPENLVSIADVFGCARTGEPGAMYCMKCGSYDVELLSTAEQNKTMLDACLEAIDRETGLAERDGGSAARFVLRDEVGFLWDLANKARAESEDSFTPEEVVRLYKNYRQIMNDI